MEVHNVSSSSSDISFNLDLTGNPPGGGIPHYSEPILLTESGWIFSRSYNSTTGEWSALNTAYFTPDTVPADASNLIISEFSYQPGEPSTPSEMAVSTNRDDYEFVELMNVGSQFVDLTGVRFTLGITFNFADNTLIPPGGRLVIVKNRAAFEARYGTAIPIATDVLGSDVYGSRLSNGGEQLTLLDASDAAIRDFIYDDALPWPYTDGSGLFLGNCFSSSDFLELHGPGKVGVQRNSGQRRSTRVWIRFEVEVCWRTNPRRVRDNSRIWGYRAS